jgi:hypothetical protein
MKRRLIALVFLLPIGIIAIACSDDTTSPADIAGLYRLLDVDGETLPATTDSTGTEVTEVTAGTLSIDPDGRYTMAITYETTPTGGAPVPGLYSEEGIATMTSESTFTLEPNLGGSWTGIVEGANLRVAVLITDISDTSVELRLTPA